MHELRVRVSCDDDAAHLALGGEIDMASAPQLVEALRAAAHLDLPAVNVDMADVTFLDSAGIAALIEGHRELERARVRLTITNVTCPVFAVMHISGSDVFLGVCRHEHA